MKKILTAGTIAIFLLSGCNMTGTDDENSLEDRNSTIEQTRYNDGNSDNANRRDNNRRMTNDGDMNERNTNDRYDVSKEAADAITREVPEVNSAYVVTMGDKAYVAAMFDDNDDGNMDRSKGDRSDRNPDTNKNNRNMSNDRNHADGGKDESTQLTDDIKEKISDVVRDQNDGIKDVYVTTNPEFSNLTRDYMDDIDAGNPIGGFFKQFGNMIERVFPQNR